jgi:hypothetical protein
MGRLHIVQGGKENGDKKWLETAASNHWGARAWIAPKSAMIGDDAVIFVPGYGFFATARIKSQPKPRPDWPNRYGAGLNSIRLIEPAISIATIRRGIPRLTWAKYPRSITTPSPTEAALIRKMIGERRKTGTPDLTDDALAEANIDELRSVALLSARGHATAKTRTIIYRARSRAIHLFVFRRAAGRCEGCKAAAPFCRADGSAYLEAHHTTRLADDGPDHPAKVIGLCPNCHRRAHHGRDAETFNRSLVKKLSSLEQRTRP